MNYNLAAVFLNTCSGSVHLFAHHKTVTVGNWQCWQLTYHTETENQDGIVLQGTLWDSISTGSCISYNMILSVKPITRHVLFYVVTELVCRSVPSKWARFSHTLLVPESRSVSFSISRRISLKSVYIRFFVCRNLPHSSASIVSTTIMYTVNQKKRGSLFLSITWLILTDFYSFYIVLIVKEFYMRLY